MIWGKTREQQSDWRCIFAVLPHRLDTGRWVWLQWVWRRREWLACSEAWEGGVWRTTYSEVSG